VISFSASLAPPLPIPARVVYGSIAFGAFVYYLMASKRAKLSRKEMTASLALWVFLGFVGLATAVAGSLTH
jgi:hypothetical protein